MAENIEQKRKKLQDQAGQLDPEAYSNQRYRPNKRKRAIRRQVYERFYYLQDEPNRREAEADWEVADKEYGMVTPELDEDDWHSNLHLPDVFSAVQTQMQETVERKSRPKLRETEDSDEPIADFVNAVLTYNMDTTGYDYQTFLSNLAKAIRGTSFRMERYRVDKRNVKIPTKVNDKGEIEYEDKEIVDFDDTITEFVMNEYIYVDEKADHIDNAVDMIEREILNIEEFHRIYDEKPGFFDTEYVVQGGDTSTRSYFRLPEDITEQDVEILHLYNKSTDAYWVVANNITICDDPLPSMHKQLPLIVDYQYRVPGRFWGIGLPKILHHLAEERKSLRNLNMDRQKMQINKMFLHNNSFDLEDEDLVTRPHGLVSVDTNGQDIRQAILPLEYGDVPASYFRTEEILLEDLRRASGIDDRISVSDSATTATQAAIVKESTLKRINMVSILSEMDAIERIGKLKWSNIQFFYTKPRIERITEENEEREEKTYRTVTVQNKKFSIANENGKKQLKMEDVQGASAVTIKGDYKKYMDLKYDIYVDFDDQAPISKAIEQTKKVELFSLFMSNPATMANMDIPGAMADVARVNNIPVDKWLKQKYGADDAMMLAENENMVMAAGQPLNGTEGATEQHTMVHLMYTQTREFEELPEVIKQIIINHILEEHDNNPATGQAAQLLGEYGLGGDPSVAGGIAGGIPGSNTPLQANTTQPQPQMADLQATNFANPE